MYSTSGRAYPDVATQGEGFQVVIGGRTESVAGTSASSPVRLFRPIRYILYLLIATREDVRRRYLPFE